MGASQWLKIVYIETKPTLKLTKTDRNTIYLLVFAYFYNEYASFYMLFKCIKHYIMSRFCGGTAGGYEFNE